MTATSLASTAHPSFLAFHPLLDQKENFAAAAVTCHMMARQYRTSEK